MKRFLLFIWHKRNWLIAIVSAVAAIFLSGALLSYHPADPSFNKASGDVASNVFGLAGAWAADLTMQFFGYASLLLVVVPLVWTVRLATQKSLSYVALRCVTLAIALSMASSLVHFIQASEQWLLYVGLGGYMGDVMHQWLVPLLGIYGVMSLNVVVFVAAFTFSIALSRSELMYIFSAMHKATAAVYASLRWCMLRLRRLIQKTPIDDIDMIAQEQIADEGEENIVEFKPEKKKKKKLATQKSLKLSPDDFEYPDFDLLVKAERSRKSQLTQGSLQQNAKLLKKVLDDFGISGEIVKIRPGPVVTLYELEPAPGTKASRVIGLADDIARSMSAISARIAVIPGRSVLGVELPNTNREIVYLRELMETDDYRDERINLPVALGKDIGGTGVMTDLARMPHLLVAGTTGSGKSVAVNAMILSLLYRLSPEQCKFIMIDPKMLELSVYEGIPHLLSPVVTEPGKAVVALKWAVKEMENRYRLMSNLGVRNIAGYNKRIAEAIKKGETMEKTVQTGFDPESGKPIYEKVPLEMKKLPFIVIIVDEMADLMLTAGKDVESSIQRLAQMARAAGLHLVMATQRPSVDVITGVIKANFPTRISFQVTSRVDSRTILGDMGAEQLLGMGDMLYMAGGGRLTRVHGPFVDDKEVEKVVDFLKTQGEPNYVEEVTQEDDSMDSELSDTGDELYDKAVSIVLRDKKASTSYIQRQLKIGYNRAANIIEKMEQEGVVSAANHAGKREVLVA